MAWPRMPPSVTPTMELDAARPIVAIWDRSPHSAKKLIAKLSMTTASPHRPTSVSFHPLPLPVPPTAPLLAATSLSAARNSSSIADTLPLGDAGVSGLEPPISDAFFPLLQPLLLLVLFVFFTFFFSLSADGDKDDDDDDDFPLPIIIMFMTTAAMSSNASGTSVDMSVCTPKKRKRSAAAIFVYAAGTKESAIAPSTHDKTVMNAIADNAPTNTCTHTQKWTRRHCHRQQRRTHISLSLSIYIYM